MERNRERWDEALDESATVGSEATLERLREMAPEGCWLCRADLLEGEDE